jgi:hypothetical protein
MENKTESEETPNTTDLEHIRDGLLELNTSLKKIGLNTVDIWLNAKIKKLESFKRKHPIIPNKLCNVIKQHYMKKANKLKSKILK